MLDLQRKDVTKKLYTRPQASNDMDVSGVGQPEHSEEDWAERQERVNAAASAQDSLSNDLHAFQRRGPIQRYMCQTC